MKSKSEIERRIDELSIEIKITRENKIIRNNAHTDNILTHSDEIIKNMLKYYEIAHLYWVLDKPIPEAIADILSRLNIAIEKYRYP